MQPKADLKIMVGIPAHNEEQAIARVVAGAAVHTSTVVVVDDGSTDLTAFQAHDAGATVIRHKCNKGKGAAVAALFEFAKQHEVDVLVLIDGDGQHNPQEIPSLVQGLFENRADVVVGSRYLSIRSEIPRDRSIGQRAFNLLTALASGVKCSDSQSGFRAFGLRAIQSMHFTETTFSVECEQQFECQVRGLKLVEVPISCSYAVPAKRSPYRQGLQVLARLSLLTYNRRLRSGPVNAGVKTSRQGPEVPISSTVGAEPAGASAGD